MHFFLSDVFFDCPAVCTRIWSLVFEIPLFSLNIRLVIQTYIMFGNMLANANLSKKNADGNLKLDLINIFSYLSK